MLNRWTKWILTRFGYLPTWRPVFRQPVSQLLEPLRAYTDGAADFALFSHGTCVLLDPGLSDADAEAAARAVLTRLLYAGSPLRPEAQSDGAVVVAYNLPALNLVLDDFAQRHGSEIERDHRKGLAPGEVLVTPQGVNAFDDVGKRALLGRAFLFLDAQELQLVHLERSAAALPLGVRGMIREATSRRTCSP